ncbi:hypothetical protein [Siccibacter colletis]|uniref:Uncharacterized protein n=1 Tax=Siccibacter colletis TaxID=1505757 RepID=A0ABY6JIF1_9ENTR|nr:hypothetical protein [Siccibacter colletis]UYU33545.1 hypothetical protein KFZ77_08615 [Siccibacter colletis]
MEAMLCTAEPDGCRQALFFFSLNPRRTALRIINRTGQATLIAIFLRQRSAIYFSPTPAEDVAPEEKQQRLSFLQK